MIVPCFFFGHVFWCISSGLGPGFVDLAEEMPRIEALEHGELDLGPRAGDRDPRENQRKTLGKP